MPKRINGVPVHRPPGVALPCSGGRTPVVQKRLDRRALQHQWLAPLIVLAGSSGSEQFAPSVVANEMDRTANITTLTCLRNCSPGGRKGKREREPCAQIRNNQGLKNPMGRLKSIISPETAQDTPQTTSSAKHIFTS